MFISEMKTIEIDLQTDESRGYLLLKKILSPEGIQCGRLLREACFRQITAVGISQRKLNPEFSSQSLETGYRGTSLPDWLGQWNKAGN